MARVARKASRVEPGGLARDSQEAHRRTVSALRRRRARGALFRLDRQSGEATGRRPVSCRSSRRANQGSFWSDSNRKRWAELKAEGLLAAAGLAAAPTDKRYAPRPEIPEMPAYFAAAMKANPRARAFFLTLPRTERRHFVVWVHLAKRPETREKRLRESIRLLTAEQKLGLK